VDDLLAEIESAASAADSDAAMAEAFVESAAQECPATRPPVTLSDLEEALGWLQGARGAVRVQPGKQAGTWRLTGLKGGAVVASLDRQVLEADASVQPLTLGAPLVENLASALPKASRMPLVIGEYEQAPYRCVEMRWVARDEIRSIESARPLMGLIQAWEGEAPAPERLREAEEEARATARQRVEAMLSRARQVEVDALCRQVEAARRRLMRELGRTLRTQSHGDLNAAFRRAVEREKGSDGRYHRALRLLGGYPTWSAEEQADADAYERSVSNHDRVGRIAGSEIDAAIHDPRWLAKRVLAEDDQGGTTRSGR